MTFYDKVLDSEEIGDFFDDVEMTRLIDHQTKFISYLLGGPASYSEERLRRTHAPFDLTNEDFDEIARLLHETLAEHKFDRGDIKSVMREIEARRSTILSTGAP
ncbi:Bacterial-like globin [Stappia aggregata IAM 12614]|uniref:Bacterial-like globin n=2 Tax=Roseibium aggregatum TaxID=187304 RepID=A0P033_ROSAI|nr:Bacterial-like globin [Stappia aggregata IAM 12614] [Roseibium aggregatum IAM 12614]